MPSEPSWFPVALTLAGFYISLLVLISEFLSLLPLLPVHIPPILLHTFSLSPWKCFHFSHVFLETLQMEKKNPFPSTSGQKPNKHPASPQLLTSQLLGTALLTWSTSSLSPLSALNSQLFAYLLPNWAKLLIFVRALSAQTIQSAPKSAISPALVFSRY